MARDGKSIRPCEAKTLITSHSLCWVSIILQCLRSHQKALLYIKQRMGTSRLALQSHFNSLGFETGMRRYVQASGYFTIWGRVRLAARLASFLLAIVRVSR